MPLRQRGDVGLVGPDPAGGICDRRVQAPAPNAAQKRPAAATLQFISRRNVYPITTEVHASSAAAIQSQATSRGELRGGVRSDPQRE
jgi:hypothetical protein